MENDRTGATLYRRQAQPREKNLDKTTEIALLSIIANIANHVEGEEFLSSLAKSFEKDAKAQAEADHPVEAQELKAMERAVKLMLETRQG